MPNPYPSINGRTADVRDFFQVGQTTIEKWVAERRIGFCKVGNNLIFGQEDVVAYWCAHRHEARGLAPGEAQETARRLWREHMALRQADQEFRAKILQRLENLEAQLRASASPREPLPCP